MIKRHPARYLALSLVTLAAGMFFYAWYYSLIIIQVAHRSSILYDTRAFRQQKVLYYWHDEQIFSEKKELIYLSDKQKTLKELVAAWLTLVHEEHALKKKVTVESVVLDPQASIAFISFDKNPFTQDQSTYAKLMFFEGLLKTLRESDIPLTKIYFLVHHKPLDDEQLDFNHPWTIQGYT